MTEPTRELYDALAEEYEAIYEDWEASVRHQGTVLARILGEADPVLDLAAGMGTQAIGLALQGRRVVARDLSGGLVARGRDQAARFGVDVPFEPADMRVARPEDAGRFGAAIAFDNALPHLLTDDDLRAALRAARAALRPSGLFAASIRDYDSAVATRPSLDPARVLGKAPHRRVVLQAWNWAEDGRSYAFDHILLRETDAGWTCHVRRGRYRALLRAELEAAARAESLSELRWLEPAESGFFQPVFVARRG